MAITYTVYSNTSNKSVSVALDFFADVTAESAVGTETELEYYFKWTTGSRDTSNLTYGPRYVKRLSDLALNKEKQSASNTANAYTNINTMVVDYLYDYINGHTANQFNSGCTVKAPIKLT